MLTIRPDDFDRDSGRKNIIGFLHRLEVKINELERTVQTLESKEGHTKKDVEDILKTEGEEGEQ